MLAEPRKMARLYALKESPLLVRGLGLRDALVGYAMIGNTWRGGSMLRLASDILDGGIVLSRFKSSSRSRSARVSVPHSALAAVAAGASAVLAGFVAFSHRKG